MINLKLSTIYTHKHIWGGKLLYHLLQNKNISTEIIDFPRIKVHKSGNLYPLIYNDILFIIDDWDYATPTYSLVNNPQALPQFYLNRPTFILKVQYSSAHKKVYQDIYNQYGIIVLPFTMFANSQFPLETFRWDKNIPYKYNCIMSGKPWRCRLRWIRFAEQNREEIGCEFNFEARSGEKNFYKQNEIFNDLLRETRWGVILKGKGDGGKNRREVEFASLGMPLALNYIPEYPFPFVPNEDFLFLREPKDLLKLKDIDPEPFAIRSYDIYNKYFSNQGIYNSFELVYRTALSYINGETEVDYSIKPLEITNIPSKTGYNFGEVKAGDKISIEYISGGWKSWGKGLKHLVSPDNTKGRGGDRARLAIYHCNSLQKKFLTLVPENTKNNPYHFCADADYNLCFIMNSDSSWSHGECNYIIKKIN